MRRRNKRIAKKFLAVIAGTCVGLLIAEGGLRLWGYRYVPLKLRLFETTSQDPLEDKEVDLGRTDWRPYHEHEDGMMEYSPSMIWRPRKNSSIINGQGFRGQELAREKGGGERRVLAIGDSNTAGSMFGPGWVEYLGRLFEEGPGNVHVINAGVWGYTSWQGLKRLEEMLAYQPDIVLVGFGANDGHSVAMPDRKYFLSKRWFKVLYRSRLCQLIMRAMDTWALVQGAENALVRRVDFAEYEKNLAEIIDLARKNRCRPILLTRPSYRDPDDDEYHPLSWINSVEQYNRISVKVAREHDVMIVDVDGHFKGIEEFFSDDGHFSDKGNHEMARWIYGRIVREFPE